MSEPITPALTPDEWAGIGYGLTLQFPPLDIGAYRSSDPGEYTAVPAVRSSRVDTEWRHAWAALALHGQPFVFTQEDVQLLHDYATLDVSRARHILGQLSDPQAGIETGLELARLEGAARRLAAHADHCTSLAARIASLLPPQP